MSTLPRIASQVCVLVRLRLELAYTQHLQSRFLIERFALAAPHPAQDLGFERDLGAVDPLAGGGPVHVARSDLRLRHEGHAGIAELGETDRVPGRLKVVL